MRLSDDPAEQRFRADLRHWLADNAPPAERLAPTNRAPGTSTDWSRRLHGAGYAAVGWPREHGGRGLGPTYRAIVIEESVRAGVPEHLNVVGLGMVGPTLVAHGTEAQQARYLPAILDASVVFCQAFSETEAGSDLAAVRTRAVPDADHLELTGSKVWSSYAASADVALVLAVTDPDAGTRDRLTCLLVDLTLDGVQVTPLRQVTGDAHFAQITFDRVRVPLDAVVGRVGDGWKVAMSTLAHERGTFGITLTARTALQLDRLLDTARDVGALDDPAVRRELAALRVEWHALRCTGYRVLSDIETTGQPGPQSSIIKLRWSALNQQACRVALRLLGSAAVDGAGEWPRYWQHEALRARANGIEGGTTEILRGVVAERVLGLPRAR